MSDNLDYGGFGLCPHCHKIDGDYVGRSHWFLCDEHKVKWLVGACRKVTRTYVRLDADERHKVDAWGFERHIPDRSAKLRALIVKGLASESTGGDAP
jgi:hypothetical protein